MKTRVPLQNAIAGWLTLAALGGGPAISTASGATGTSTKEDRPRIEVCFVLDTTGSMSGLIEGAKQKIWSIANEMVSAKPTPEVRMALLAYRDRGDTYITKLFDLTNDIDAVYANLQGFRADGGGDGPESVNQALHEAVTRLVWSDDRKVLKIIFLVGDAPPHMDYANDVKYPEVCQQAVKRDVVINTVQCGGDPATTAAWTKIAALSEGKFAAIAQSGGMAAIPTPMDADLAELSRKLGATAIAYGGASERRALTAKLAASEAAPAPVAADRLAFYSMSGARPLGDTELLESLAGGKVKLDSIKKEQLPEDLRKLDAAAFKAEIEKRQNEREAVQARIQKLNKAREDYLAQERKRLAATGKADSFDETVAQTIRAQAARKGIHYGK